MAARKHTKAICENCALKDAPYVPSFMPSDAAVCFIGEAPGLHEVNQGTPFVGASGQLLHAVMGGLKVLDEQTALTNTVACRPPGNRDPTFSEIMCCQPRLIDELSALPKHAWCVGFGNTARSSLAPLLEGGITTLAGLWEYHAPSDRHVTFCIHPAAVLRDPSKWGQMFVETLRRAMNGPNYFDLETVKHTVCSTWRQVKSMMERLEQEPTIVYDLETDQINWREDEILCIGLAASPTEAYIVPGATMHGEGKPFLGRLMENPEICFVGHNGKFDVKFMRHQVGINARIDFDTMIAHYALNELKGTHALKMLVQRYFGLPDYEKDLVQKYLKSRSDYYSKVPSKNMYRYCAIDVCATFKLYMALNEELVAQGLYEQPFQVPMMAALEVLTAAEMHGMHIDVDYAFDQLDSFGADIAVLASALRKKGHNATMNPNSAKQVAHAMYDVLRMPIVRGRDVKERSTSKGAVALLSKEPLVINDPVRLDFLDTLRQYRRVSKLKSAYLVNLLDYTTQKDRVHGTFMMHGTEMGRLAVSRPALQTIPRKDDREAGDYGTRIKRMFSGEKDPKTVLMECDYSQAELRVFAALTQEQFLLNVYEEDRDLHTEVAVGMFGTNFTSENRAHCKMFNFSYLYGGNEHSFALDTGIPIDKAKRFVQQYDLLMPKAAAWKQSVVELTRKRGYAESLFGRRRRFPIITNENFAEVRKATVHFLVASVATDLTLLAATQLHRELPDGAAVVLLVHDSVMVECRADITEPVAALMHDVLVAVAEEYVPTVAWKAGVKVGDDWAALEAL